MKVAVVCTYASFVEVNVAEAFERVGIDAWIVRSAKPRVDYRGSRVIFESYGKTVELPSVLNNRLLGGYAPFPIVPNLVEAVKKLDVGIANVSENVSPETWLLSQRKGKCKIVLTQHAHGGHRGVRDRIYDYLAPKLLIHRLDGFVGIGLRAKRFLESLGARNVNVIPNPIDDSLFKPISSYESRENVILFVGKVSRWRGLHLLLRAMREVRKRIDDAKLMIIGDAGDLSNYVARDKWIRYLGPRAHLEMPQYYNLARVFANPIAGEAGCGCASEEALACGTPVVGSTYLDFPFSWRNGEIGYLVKPDSNSFAEGIIQALRNGSELHRECRKIALREFSRESVGTRYLEVFEHLLNS